MSKKKGGSTMTLKDFHGGSIPSDLSLPSAPGVSTARPSDRGGYDRPISGGWGPTAASGGLGRPDLLRPRPGSAGGVPRGFDEVVAPAFLSHPSHIGRHFDEDERKPFDASSAPRRPTADAAVRVPRPVVESKLTSPTPQQQLASSRPAAPVAAHLSAGSGFGSSQLQGSSGNSSSAPNAWAVRKEAVAVTETQVQPTATWSGPGAASRFAQLSAIEKVSSGRWQSKHVASSHPPPDVEVIEQTEIVGKTVVYGGGVGLDRRPSERDNGRAKSPIYPEAKERSVGSGFVTDMARPASADGRFVGQQMPQQGQGIMEVPERPKLNLLPRTKPLEASDTRVSDYKQGHQPPSMDSSHSENVREIRANSTPSKSDSVVIDEGNRPADRPRLNLKPRSQRIEQSDETIEKERKTLFGGARPRELVLKERGIDDDTLSNVEQTSPVNRFKHDSPKPDMKLNLATPTNRHGERAENYSPEQKVGRDFVRKDHHAEPEKMDVQRTSWRNDNHRNFMETEKHQEQRRQEHESWRKPVEPPKPDGPGPRFGKGTTALELAQAFSRSVSDTGHSSSQRSVPGHNQAPFSRLTETRELYSGPSPRKINGY